jgi:hypothetical protein
MNHPWLDTGKANALVTNGEIDRMKAPVRLDWFLQRLFFGFGISAILFCRRSLAGTGGTMAWI